jgi:hypothetical protein
MQVVVATSRNGEDQSFALGFFSEWGRVAMLEPRLSRYSPIGGIPERVHALCVPLGLVSPNDTPTADGGWRFSPAVVTPATQDIPPSVVHPQFEREGYLVGKYPLSA